MQRIRGTHDLMPQAFKNHQWVVEKGREWAALFGFQEISTPILENKGVFDRAVGETSDIVSKEMYEVLDKGGGEGKIVLRPEGTAAVVRALIENGLTQTLPQKFFYYGPMFRYDRPQKGRLRQFHQVGVEHFGAIDPLTDVDVLALAGSFLKSLSVGVTLEINTLGDQDSRGAYKDILVRYLTDFQSKLSADSQQRLLKNPLRILDSKAPEDKEILKNAPLLSDSLNESSYSFFEQVKEGLSRLNIPFVVNPGLVRGLDYYCHTAFEFTTEALGAQGTVLAGGRYDGLVQMMGGPSVPAIGWAAGVERLALLMGQDQPLERPVVILPLGQEEQIPCLQLAQRLRDHAVMCDVLFQGAMGKRMKTANRLGASYAVIMGDEERATGQVTLKNLGDGFQETISVEHFIERMIKS